jgi:negative regulator of flagellin synthesis FlgM
MKIDPQRSIVSPADATPVEGVRSRQAGKSSGADAPADSVVLSGDLQLVEAAMKAANEAPEVRADEVARARKMLERGEVGNDLEALAAKMLDSILPS